MDELKTVSKKAVTCILGPTGIGKSAYAMELASALEAEIISADAYQVYVGMDIGTAKPSANELSQIKHHLIDIKTPEEHYSVNEFCDLTKAIIAEKKNTPLIICGGTGLFLKAFLYNYSFPEAKSDPKVRQKWTECYEEKGKEYVWEQLKKWDPATAAIVHPNNKHQIIRAVELYELTGVPPSQSKSKETKIRDDVAVIGLKAERSVVTTRIEKRVDTMIANGLVEEVEGLLKSGYSPTLHAFNSIGYKEVIEYINGSISHGEMVDLIKVHTRQFSKRQLTWYNTIENVHWKTISD